MSVEKTQVSFEGVYDRIFNNWVFRKNQFSDFLSLPSAFIFQAV